MILAAVKKCLKKWGIVSDAGATLGHYGAQPWEAALALGKSWPLRRTWLHHFCSFTFEIASLWDKYRIGKLFGGTAGGSRAALRSSEYPMSSSSPARHRNGEKYSSGKLLSQRWRFGHHSNLKFGHCDGARWAQPLVRRLSRRASPTAGFGMWNSHKFHLSMTFVYSRPERRA